MGIKIPDPQYLFDSSGKKSLVVLRIEEYEELVEDLHDIAVIVKRRDEQKMSLDEFEKGLKSDEYI